MLRTVGRCFWLEGPDNFADAAALLLRDALLRKRLADAGHDLVLRKYAWAVLAWQFDALYGALIEEKQHGMFQPPLVSEQR